MPENSNPYPPPFNSVCVCGAGTMGEGIAQVIAQHDIQTILFDVNVDAISKARKNIHDNLQKLVLKNKISETAAADIFGGLKFTSDVSECKADLVIEAIIEKIEIKKSLFNTLSNLNGELTVFASNTSSLSITLLQRSFPFPERLIGLHFFNPATIMKLVEVVKGEVSDPVVIERMLDFCRTINKTPVVCIDAPGFIVNRVARHYYLEAMRMVENGSCKIEDVDAVMEASGFKLGPFKLMDLIGMDINLSVSQQLFEASGKKERFRPSQLQIELVDQKKLGKKTGQGFYNYS